MYNKNLLSDRITDCVIAHGLVRQGLELRRSSGIGPVEEFQLEAEYHKSVAELVQRLIDVVDKVVGV